MCLLTIFLLEPSANRFVRREKEIAETKREASESESLRYRQRADFLQRELDETIRALETERQRTQGRMLSEQEFADTMEKVRKFHELDVANKEHEKARSALTSQNKTLNDKVFRAVLCSAFSISMYNLAIFIAAC